MMGSGVGRRQVGGLQMELDECDADRSGELACGKFVLHALREGLQRSAARVIDLTTGFYIDLFRVLQRNLTEDGDDKVQLGWFHDSSLNMGKCDHLYPKKNASSSEKMSDEETEEEEKSLKRRGCLTT